MQGATAEACVAAAGMVVFALFVHRLWPLKLASLAGLVAAGLALARGAAAEPSLGAWLGLGRPTRRTACFAAAGLALGLGLAVAYRLGYGLTLLPGALRPFVAVSVAIGIAEELVYRGHIQGRLRVLGAWRAVGFAAVAHTAYKTALFMWPPAPVEVNYLLLVVATFLAGLVVGAFRAATGSLLPAVIAHAAFDLAVYGGQAQAPWWVWS